MENKLLEVNNLQKIYHDKSGEVVALSDISFDVKEHEFVSIIGPSGCGKSTILSILAGLEKASEGDFNFNKNTTIGYMLQKDSLLPFRNILDNCLIGLEINGTLNEENKKYVIKLLETYGLKEFIYKYPANLSGGMRQRVG